MLNPYNFCLASTQQLVLDLFKKIRSITHREPVQTITMEFCVLNANPIIQEILATNAVLVLLWAGTSQ